MSVSRARPHTSRPKAARRGRRALGCLLALSAATFAGGQGRRVHEWRSPTNRARLQIDWVEPAAVSGDAEPPWPFLVYVQGASTKTSTRIEDDVLADTSVALAARVCRLVRITPDQAASLPYLKQLPRIADPMLVVVGRDLRVHGALLDDRKLTAASCLELMAKAVDTVSEVPLRHYLSSYLGIIKASEEGWRDEQRLLSEQKGETAQAIDLERRLEDIASAERSLAEQETELLRKMRVHSTSVLAPDDDAALSAAEREALRSYREHASRANAVDAAYALAALRGDSAAMASAILKEAGRSSWSAWKAGDALAEMRSAAALRTVRDALSQRGPSRDAALAAAALRPIPGCEDALVALAEDRDPAVREAAIGALGVQRGSAALEALAAALDDPDAGVRVLAVRGLGVQGCGAHVPALAARLDDADWCVRRAAAAALAKLRVRESVPPLLDCLASGDGSLREDALSALVRVTGRTFGFDPEPWSTWWMQAGATFTPPVKTPPETAFDDAVRGFAWPLAYGSIGTLSSRLVFVIDTGVEMGRKPNLPPDAPDSERERLWSGDRLDLAKTDLVNALRGLEREASFNVLAFAGKVTWWRNTPARGWAAKGAVAWVKDLKACVLSPMGSQQSLRGNSTKGSPTSPHVFREGEHDVYSAVLAALGVSGPDPLSDRARPPYDTVFLVVDGNPDGGAVQQIPRIAEIAAKLNRSRGVVIHVVTFSGPMRNAYAEIAKATGGRHASYGP